jgi:hypothetical protein
MLYNALRRNPVPRDFNAKSLDVQHTSTKIMRTIQSASWDVNLELFDAELSRLRLVALPASLMANVAEVCDKSSNNVIKHWLLRLGWTREKVKWGNKAYARVIFLRPGYQIKGGTLYGPGGWQRKLATSDAFVEYSRDDWQQHTT